MDMEKTSKRLAYLLRHDASSIDSEGWADIKDICSKLHISRTQLEGIVSEDNKGRYAIKGNKVRAVQGHSVPVNLQLVPCAPPPVLFHGTTTEALKSIMKQGIQPRDRQYVHLSADEGTAWTVARRRSGPVVLVIDTASMDQDFYLSENGVWLTASAPPSFIEQIKYS